MFLVRAILCDAGIDWKPDLHDNTKLDWAITLGYLAAGVLCLYAWRVERRLRMPKPAFWCFVGILMLFLGVNKQINLQTLVEELGRDAATDSGLYERKRTLQRAFVTLLGLGGIAGLAALAWWVRRHWRRYGLAIVGLIFAALYAGLRAATFNHVVREPHGPRHHPYSQEILEVIAVLATCAGTYAAIWGWPKRRAKPRAFERIVPFK